MAGGCTKKGEITVINLQYVKEKTVFIYRADGMHLSRGASIGHQFGGGRGKDVATVVGALGGGYAGNQIQGSMQESDTYTTTQQRCKTVYDKSEKMLGYDVTYKIGDQQGKIRMDKDPGTQIPLDGNGQLVLNNKA